MRTKREQAAWVQHMLDEHEELRSILNSTHVFLEDPRPRPGDPGFQRWTTAMSEQLAVLHDGLFRHFREEQECGVFEDLVARYPRAATRLERLQKQHDCLLADLRDIMDEVVEYSAGTALDDPRLRRTLLSVLDRIEIHEQSETELMQRMFYNDIGEGD